ncbi:AT-rich interactive domain-containing protein 5B isoform X1 [Esox lucius]|uniref:AT-rich interactive domain-containing protein 5B isoform X1 n=1 Tax=Esox lucius TaxID=8010 RepID=UPI001476D668|nr:AT-rich interactive domain-containing protein 5B isoform X1 [Esox lucius]
MWGCNGAECNTGSPSCLRGSFAFYKSVSCGAGAPARVWRLGEFYYVRCGPQEPVCIAEVTLLWEDQVQRHLLASSRLYFLPEDTPKGRTREHGEDEVLAVSKKIVVRVEDLVRWTCHEPPGWKGGSQRSSQTNGHHSPTLVLAGGVPTPPTEKAERLHLGVKVLSYPQYCRFRSLQRRIQDRVVLGLQDPHLLALGGIKVAQHNTRVFYCRDTFNHPTLDSNASVWTQLECTSLSLKGRPRKRRGRPESQKAVETPALNQSVSWIERMKENVMGSAEMPCEGGWLPHPEEQLFLDQLYYYMESRGSPIGKVPNLGFKKIDLFVMYSVVKRLGGYDRVTSQRLWKKVYNELGGCPGSTSAATCTRRHYERLMLPYEEHINGGAELKFPASSGPTQSRGVSGRRALVKGRGPEPNQKKKMTVTPSPPPAASPDGVVVVKRGRGRPPGKKNQAKLLACKASPTAPSPPGKPSADLGNQAQQDPSLQSLSVFQGFNLANLPLTPDLSPMSAPFLPLLPRTERELKVEKDNTPAPSPTLSHPRLHTGGSLGAFSPTKGLCPLGLFRSQMGLAVQDRPGLTPQDPASQQPSSLQVKAEGLDTNLPNGDQPNQSHHQCLGCSLDEAAQRGDSRPPMPPLRVLPLDLDCSLHVRQLMRTRLGSADLLSFTKRLSQVLAQDLTSKPCLPVTPPPEQALPLNLSKRSTTKRSSLDTESRMSVEDQDSGDATLSSAKRPRVELCDEAEDLSSPSRARAFLLELPQCTSSKEEEEEVRKSCLLETEPKKDCPVRTKQERSDKVERGSETMLEEGISERESKTMLEEGISERESKTMLEEGISERESKTMLEEGISERESKTMLEEGISERESKTMLEEGISERESKTMLEEGISERESKTKLEEGISERESKTKLEEGISERESKTKLEEGISERESKTKLEEGISESKTNMEYSVSEGENQRKIEEGISEGEVETKNEDNISRKVEETEDSIARPFSISVGQHLPKKNEETDCDVDASLKGPPCPGPGPVQLPEHPRTTDILTNTTNHSTTLPYRRTLQHAIKD